MVKLLGHLVADRTVCTVQYSLLLSRVWLLILRYVTEKLVTIILLLTVLNSSVWFVTTIGHIVVSYHFLFLVGT